MDRAEWGRALEELHGAGFAWALACCAGRREEAMEALQTTYVKVLDGRARFDGASSLKTWLFAVIRRTAAEQRRRSAIRRVLLARWAGRRAPEPPNPGPDETAEASERGGRIRRALLALSPRQRQVLDLVFFHDLTVEEAAAVMGLRVGTARVHYERGKKALLGRMEREGIR
jgi:RNA polymerase sigma-70 factor (ECF subfamily)